MTTIERQCLEEVANLMAINLPGYYRSIHAWMCQLPGYGYPPMTEYRSAIVWC